MFLRRPWRRRVDRHEAAKHGGSKPRNQHWIDLLRSTAGLESVCVFGHDGNRGSIGSYLHSMSLFHAVPFLTLEDPNAKIKGSRDPLGVQPIWSAFGRHVVTNLTTQSTSVRGFTILLLGRYFAADLVDRGMATREEALDVFLRMEQLGAYVRHVAHEVEGEIRGIERVKRFVDEQHGRVIIAANRKGMILSDQKVYGLWGLYSVPARTSGLIPNGSLDVSPAAREFIERNYISKLNSSATRLRRLLARGGRLRTSGRDAIFAALTVILDPHFSSDELEFYGSYLRDGKQVDGTNPGRQERFRRFLESDGNLSKQTGRAEILHLAKHSRKRDEGLSVALERIVCLEAFLAPSAVLFQHTLGRHGQGLSNVASEVRRVWRSGVPNLDRSAFAKLLSEIRSASTEVIGSRMEQVHGALSDGDFEGALEGLLSWNESVMQLRGGAPWARIGDGRRIDVRYRGAEQLLLSENELPELWTNSYFVDALKNVTQQLKH